MNDNEVLWRWTNRDVLSGIPGWLKNGAAVVVLSLVIYIAWRRIETSFEGNIAHWITLAICVLIGAAIIVEAVRRESTSAGGVEIRLSPKDLWFSVAGQSHHYPLSEIDGSSITIAHATGVRTLAFTTNDGNANVHVPLTWMSLQDRRALLKAFKRAVAGQHSEGTGVAGGDAAKPGTDTKATRGEHA